MAYPSAEGRLFAIGQLTDDVAMFGKVRMGSVHERIDGH